MTESVTPTATKPDSAATRAGTTLPLIRLALVFFGITLIAWPIFVVCNVLLSAWGGEGAMLDAYQLEPRRLLAIDFLMGLKQTLPVTLCIGLFAVIDYLLLARVAQLKKAIGLLLITAGTALTLWALQPDTPVLMTTLASAIIIFLIYRIALYILRLTPRTRRLKAIS